MSQPPRRPYRRGSILLVRLDPVLGSEQGKTRPCVVMSDAKTTQRSRAKLLYGVVPLTRSETLTGPLAPRIKARPGGSTADGVALCMHVRAVDPVRVVGYVGELDDAELQGLRLGLAVFFGLEGTL